MSVLLSQLFSYTDAPVPFDDQVVDALIDAIDACKILDPACGSGAFPMGILHKLVFILGKLDPGNVRWKQRQLDKLDSAPMREELERTFRDNDDDYGRKLYLIENCIYGVDIQPIAIQISKLRFFISLLCDQRTNRDKAKNCGVRPLPNLETKFVAANTLIALDKGQDNVGQMLLFDQRLPKLEAELKAVRHKHFAAQRRKDKLDLQKKDCELRKQIAAVLADGGMSAEASRQLAAWDPYDQNISAPFFDPEWMFGIAAGFDVVIGNPPYIPIEKMTEQEKAFYRSRFSEQLTRKYDSSVVFILSMLEQLTHNGVLAYISSLTWQTGQNFSAFRKWLLSEHGLRILINLPFDVFKAAYVDTGVYLIGKVPTSQYGIYRFPKKSVDLEMSGLPMTQVPVSLVSPPEYRIVLNPFATSLLRRWVDSPGFLQLGDITNSTQGLSGNLFLPTDGPKNKTVLPYLHKGQIYRYCLSIEETYLTDMADKPSLIRYYQADPKLIIRRVINRQDRLMATFCSDELVFKKDANPFIFTETSHSPKFILGVLNSSLLSFVYVNTSSIATKDDFRQTTLAELRVLPVPNTSASKQEILVALVDRILEAKSRSVDEDVTEMDAELDARVAHLYDLTESEYRTILADTNTPDDFQAQALEWFGRIAADSGAN